MDEPAPATGDLRPATKNGRLVFPSSDPVTTYLYDSQGSIRRRGRKRARS